jgi:hypothetical protein
MICPDRMRLVRGRYLLISAAWAEWRKPVRTRAMVRRAVMVTWVLIASMSIASAQTGTLRALLVEYRCPVVDRLDRIFDHPKPTDYLDRFLAVTLAGHPHGYVQCIFIANRTRVLCEASSGYHYSKVGAPRTFFLPRDAVAALGKLGFSTDDSKGNFRYEAGIDAPPDLNAIADLILTALHDAYGARADNTLNFNAPFARGATSKCIPVS